MSDYTTDGFAYDWDSEIENDGQYTLLPEGDYDFTVESFERARHNGSDKMPPCNKAIVKLRVEAPEGAATITENLFLHSKTEWKLCSFFTSIGQRKSGDKYRMDWSLVPGAHGRAHVYVDTYTGNNGDQRQSNKIRKFLEPTEVSSAQPPTAPQTGKTWQGGKF